MYNILIENIKNKYEYEELIKVFFRPDQFRLFTEEDYGKLEGAEKENDWIVFNETNFPDKNQIKREIWQGLSQITGERPPWGILTGVRPVKLAEELWTKFADRDTAKEKLIKFYLLKEEKADLLLEICDYQRQALGSPDNGSVGLYIGIPFCPTRCLYCSFTSNQKESGEIDRYLDALKKEIRWCGTRMRETGLYPETIYIGGGTPTTLNPSQLAQLLEEVDFYIDRTKLKEFTVEAGRPDTITREKLRILKEHQVGRISINPQSMKDATLERIGRSHKAEDIKKAFSLAREEGGFLINGDVIAGLPGENTADFRHTLEEMIAFGTENITVHTLAVKRASRLIEEDKDYHYKQGATVAEMLKEGNRILREAGYRPYYLYRQKHMAGSFENVGYCKNDTPCLYNIRIMEERQTILALGAGGISKVYFPSENRLERVANVSNYEIYISRLDEMLARKEENLFKEVSKC